ncbi:hypothetical protein LCM4573_25295 [Rhizobium sp. LCM 4573]|nr:hypothetical protein LCM4573_25295 [Rhizobium sp. LCM 4573]
MWLSWYRFGPIAPVRRWCPPHCPMSWIAPAERSHRFLSPIQSRKLRQNRTQRHRCLSLFQTADFHSADYCPRPTAVSKFALVTLFPFDPELQADSLREESAIRFVLVWEGLWFRSRLAPCLKSYSEQVSALLKVRILQGAQIQQQYSRFSLPFS